MIDKDKVIQLAKEAAGVADAVLPTEPDPQVLEWLERFAQAIYRQGLEDAAKVCEANQDFEVESNPTRINFSIANVMARQCAAAISSLKESTNG